MSPPVSLVKLFTEVKHSASAGASNASPIVSKDKNFRTGYRSSFWKSGYLSLHKKKWVKSLLANLYEKQKHFFNKIIKRTIK